MPVGPMIRYHDVPEITREQAERALSSGSVEEISHALAALAFHEPDFRWVQELCLNYLDSSDRQIGGLAATCLGHLARIHKAIDKDRVLAALRRRLTDAELSGRIEDAIDDIEMLCQAGHGKRPGHVGSLLPLVTKARV